VTTFTAAANMWNLSLDLKQLEVLDRLFAWELCVSMTMQPRVLQKPPRLLRQL